MKSNLCEAEPSREPSRSSVVSSLVDALALQQHYFEQSLVSQELRTKQLAYEQEASIKAAAKELGMDLKGKRDYAPTVLNFEGSDYKEGKATPGDGRQRRSQSKGDNDKRSRDRNLLDEEINYRSFPHSGRSRSRDRSSRHQRSKCRDRSQSKDGKWLEHGIVNRSSYHRSRSKSKDRSLVHQRSRNRSRSHSRDRRSNYRRSRYRSRSRSRERSPQYQSRGQCREERLHCQSSGGRISSRVNSPLGRETSSRRERSPHYKRHRGRSRSRSRIRNRSVSRDRSKSQERKLFLTKMQSRRYPKKDSDSCGTQNLETAESFSGLPTDDQE